MVNVALRPSKKNLGKKSLQDFFKKKHEKSGEVWIENEFICEI